MFSKIIDSETTNKLYENEEFCTKLGKVILLSNKLGQQLLRVLQDDSSSSNTQKPPFGMLIKYIEKKEFFPAIVPALQKMTENNIDTYLNNVITMSLDIESSTEDTKIDIYIDNITILEDKLNLIYTMIRKHNNITL
ncbi:MAG: hypothetical protein WBG69_04795 [Arcobacteraceae bacterium]